MCSSDLIGEGFVYVPGGPFVYGEGKDTRTIELPDFAIAEKPVTFGEWGGVPRGRGTRVGYRRKGVATGADTPD